jgi:hypothetical protein
VVGRAPTHLTAQPPGTCGTLSALISLTNDVFGAGSPDANSAIGKLNNIQHQIDIANYATAKEHAFTLVQFILAKWKTGGLPGSQAQVVSLVNAIFCYVGLAVEISDPFNTSVIFPTDSAATIVSSDGSVGTVLPTGSVTEPSVISFRAIVDTFTTPGAGPLHTRLDQYRGYIGLSHQSETNAGFTQPVVVGVCTAPGIPTSVRARLRLGHDASTGFEITPPADASFLHCPTTTSQVRSPGWLRSLANLVLPSKLYATQEEFFSAGVGGTAGEYSDFAPVDPEVEFSAGVGGTAGEYIRLPGSTLRLGSLISGNGCDPIEAPVGTAVDDVCLPFIKLATPLGTPLTGVTVAWDVTAGAGSIAPRTLGVCGGFGSLATTTTSSFGKAGICWTLGAAGTNSVTATPSLTGDAAVGGVVFNPPVETFNAIANPAVSIVFDQQPPSTMVAGTPFAVSARVVDKYGNPVMGSSDPVTLSLNQYSFAGGLTSTTANAASGYVTFSGLQINKAATDYTLSANGAFIALPYGPATSNTFSVTADAPFSMAMLGGNDQTAAAGTVLPVNPSVLVSDQFGNPVPGVAVSWTTGASSAGAASPALTLTSASGTTSTMWTVGDGLNELTAAVVSAPGISQLFSATGTSTMVVLNQCAAGGSGDPINDPGKTYAFYVPNPGNHHTISEIQLYLSSSGQANVPNLYSIKLTTQLGTFDPAVSVPVATTANVFLRGNNSEKKLITFKLSTPIVGSGGGPNVMIRLSVLTNPDGSKINFNTGPCSPGTSCKPPNTCSATEVNSYTPYPAGTLYRKSVGIIVKGS